MSRIDEKVIEAWSRWRLIRRLGVAAYRAGFEKLWPGEWGGA